MNSTLTKSCYSENLLETFLTLKVSKLLISNPKWPSHLHNLSSIPTPPPPPIQIADLILNGSEHFNEYTVMQFNLLIDTLLWGHVQMSVYRDVAMRLNKTHCFKCELHVVQV